ncbi:hypothetical protein H311_00986 [Anncaliia algerae PRA109]|nr:hypothetical protein H311_00986 [Anncaliia algerae PRA109]
METYGHKKPLINYNDTEIMPATTCVKCFYREIISKGESHIYSTCSWCSIQHRLFKSQIGTIINLFNKLRFVCYFILGIGSSAMCLMLDKGKETAKKHI